MKFKDFFSRWKKLLSTIGAFAFVIISIILLDFMRRGIMADKFQGKITVIGSFKNPNNINEDIQENSENTTLNSIEDSEDSENSAVFSANIKLNIGQGSLVLINSQYPPVDFYEGICNIEENEEKYTLNSPQIPVSEKALPYLMNMIDDYNSYSEKNNIVICDSENLIYSQTYPENISGYSVDIAVKSSAGEIIAYDGMDTEGWISENCQNYGFITRYPEDKGDITGYEYSPFHFRYVGIPHSLIMAENNFCLEEYIEYIKNYNYQNPLEYSYGESKYIIYYISADTDSIQEKLPPDANYEISGNNCDGYIISVLEASEIPEIE